MTEGGENHREPRLRTYSTASSIFVSNAVQVPNPRKMETSRTPPHSPRGDSPLICNFIPQLSVRGQNKACTFLCLWPHASDRVRSIHSSTHQIFSKLLRNLLCAQPWGDWKRGTEVRPPSPCPRGFIVNQGKYTTESLHLLCHQCECV